MSFEKIDGIIKTCRDIMRKDKGMNTDAQRLPQLLWLLFLKCFDDFERQKDVLGEHESVIEKPYRWRDWTDSETGRRGIELIEFVNNDLFKYLQNLRGGDGRDQRDVIADIFLEQKNYMTEGYLLKDVINQINKLDLTSSEQFHLIGTVYEKMLLSMRDDSPGTFGEFYTPRPVIKFMVEMIKPSIKKRETILDPACGTAGFLIESFNYLEKQVKGTKDNEFLQKECLHGIEPRPDPYLFSMMNMMLHGILEPNIVRANTLETPINDIRENQQVDIILTNPPFGGEEQESIKKKFPAEFQTKDTAIGFLLHCITRLKDGGRCAMILPDGGILSSGGVAQKVREKLLTECNLHTIIRLHNSVFKPYAGIGTNIFFFNKGEPTNEIWCYQTTLREGIKAYNKTNPIQYDDFKEIIEWWNDKKEKKNLAWKVNVTDLKNFDLDLKNLDSQDEILEYSPHELIEKIVQDEENTLNLLKQVKELIEKEIPK